MKRFFLIGGYTHGNPGDEAILNVTIAHLSRIYPASAFDIWSDRDQWTAAGISSSSKLVRFDPISFVKRQFGPSASGFLNGLYRRGYPISSGLAACVVPGTRAVVERMKQTDAVIFIGGGYLNSNYNLPKIHFLCHLAIASGRPIYFLGHTLGPFHRLQDRWMVREMLRKARGVVVRDAESLLETQRFSVEAFIGADQALAVLQRRQPFSKTSLERYVTDGRNGRYLLGLNLRKSGDSGSYYPELAQRLTAFLKSSPRKTKIVFLPMETSVFCDDREEAKIFARHLPADVDYAIVDEHLTAEECTTLISWMDGFISMRFHSLVFALSHGIPSAGLYHGEYYRRKITGLFKLYGLDRFGLPLNALSALPERMSEMEKGPAQLEEFIRGRTEELVRQQDEIFGKLFN